jgi:hypothetical protein
VKKDAELWARQMETRADRLDLAPDPKALDKVTLRELVERYRDNVTVTKRRAETETEKIVLMPSFVTGSATIRFRV